MSQTLTTLPTAALALAQGHLREDGVEVPFLGAWYVAGMLIPAGLGAAAGRRLLRW
jgi:hypothetical protein